ncbi:MAG: DUF3306 domain-containing protein [Burkholderiales bacterium]|nr:DUF3306 domain-containing protein [Burkholderiales bacterium]
MAHEREPFLERWSRLKRERAAAPQTQAAAPPPGATARGEPAASEPPPLPPIESLTPESDFSAFMHPKVPELLRRAALKKLFQDPRYNVVDRFEAYWEDYTQAEPVPPELLEKLDQARRHVFGDSAGGDAPAAESASRRIGRRRRRRGRACSAV